MVLEGVTTSSSGSDLRPTHLDDAGAVLEVGERPHDVLTHGLNGLLPTGREASDQLGDPGCRQEVRQKDRKCAEPV